MAPTLNLQSLGDLRLRGPAGDLLRHRRKELALLVVLASRAPRPVRREEIQALFWGERDEQRARHSLRQSLLRIRQTLGDTIVEIAPDTLRLAAGVRWDVREFGDAVASGRLRDAIDMWTGDFMVACEDVGGEDFTTWFEAERERLRRVLYSCFTRVVDELEAAHAFSDMAAYGARWSEVFSLDEEAAARHIEALCFCADAGAATGVRAAFIHRLRGDLGDEPSAEWLARTTRAIGEAPLAPLAPITQPMQPEGAPLVPQRHPRFSRARAIQAAVVIAILATGAVGFALMRPFADPQRTLAIGHIETLGMPDSAAALPSLLAINLARAADLSIVTAGRMQEVRVQLGSRNNSAADMQRAARAAGADEIIEGVVARRHDGVLRLDLNRIDLGSNASRATYRVEGKDLFTLVDAAAERIAGDLGVELSADRLAGTTSLTATRLYEEGLRAYYGGEELAGGRLFRLALREDSTFAMAAYYASRVPGMVNGTELLRQAHRMAAKGSDRDRLFIEVQWLGARDEPAQLAVAETLAIRYPEDPSAQFAYARALLRAGSFLKAVPHFRRVVDLDSLSLRGLQARCLACDAYQGTLEAYRFADSVAAAEKVAREWTSRQPRSAFSWYALGVLLGGTGRYRAAMDAFSHGSQFDKTNRLAASGLMDMWIRSGDFDSADRFWNGLLATPGHELHTEALSHAVSSLRVQGKLVAAADAATKLKDRTVTPDNRMGASYLLATVLHDLGRYHEAAALFDTISAPNPNDSGARQGRNRAWFLTHAATAVAAMGDTTRLRLLEDTIRVNGARSGFRRDQLLHHYVRGLRLRLLGNPHAAVIEFRRSLFSPVEGNTRASVELARTLLDLNRPAEAARVLQSAYWGPIGASGQYVSRTEHEALLGRAFEMTSRPDSALMHYQWALNAWKHADPMLVGARRDIRMRVERLAVR